MEINGPQSLDALNDASSEYHKPYIFCRETEQSSCEKVSHMIHLINDSTYHVELTTGVHVHYQAWYSQVIPKSPLGQNGKAWQISNNTLT